MSISESRAGRRSRARKRLIVAVAAPALAVATVSVSMSSASASASSTATVTDGVNGVVYASTHIGDRTIIGGSFTWAGPSTAGAVPVDGTTGVRTSMPRVNGTVNAAARDGSGGWYVGGVFEFAGGFVRNGAARVTSAGVVTSWNPQPTGQIRAIASVGNVVYLGGSFTAMDGTSRSGLAAVDRVTGALLPWNPGVSGTVSALAVSADGTTVYVGGSFSGLGGQSRANLGAVGTDGTVSSWAPGVNGPVNALAVQGSAVYAGGSFTSAGGAARTNLAGLDAAGTALPWSADTDGPVNALANTSTTLYLGGQFSLVGGLARSNLGALDMATGSVTSFAGGVDGSVTSLTVNSTATTVYAGGTFTSAAGQTRLRAAAFTSAGALTGWDPRAEATVTTVALSGGAVMVGGNFSMLNGYPRTNAAAIRGDGSVDPSWNPSPNNTVYAVAATADGTRVFLGGTFTSVGPSARTYIAAVDAVTGATDPNWTKAANNTVRALAVSGQVVYAGGSFTRAGGGDAIRIAALTVANGTPVPGFTAAAPNNTVKALLTSPDGTKLYAVGGFNAVGASSRPGAAQLDAATGALTSFAPSAGGAGIAAALTPDGSRFYFSTTSNRTYAYDPAGATPNNPVHTIRTGGDVQAIGASATEIYVGGHFTNLPVEHLARMHAAAFSVSTGTATAWDPGPDGIMGVWAISVTGSTVTIGGDFLKVGGKTQPGFARFGGTP
ncbi:hypothetical protein EV643_105318 [Kribbella sp. VKM Ac-2527]|uniref:Pyrroloquinoline-quinone binding quinoprotein n=1 Tax=Kribbella caucasensis TaxID=2512215 RepID=A0A4R6KHV4_9ACTN|nr:hypothetical protein EV643_105318 [Kribbella sp. VKM Ac-2527]